MLSLYNAIRNRRRGPDLVNRAAELKDEVRTELTEDILYVVGGDEKKLDDIDVEIEQAQERLLKAEKSQEFVGMRYRKYKDVLEERSVTLRGPSSKADDDDEKAAAVNDEKEYLVGQEVDSDDESDEEEEDDDDEEAGKPALTPEERQRQLAKLEQDEAALEKVLENFKTLSLNVDNMKKRVFALERQRDEVIHKTAECKEFLVASAVVEGNQESALQDYDDDSDSDDEDSDDDDESNSDKGEEDVEAGGEDEDDDAGRSDSNKNGTELQESSE